MRTLCSNRVQHNTQWILKVLALVALAQPLDHHGLAVRMHQAVDVLQNRRRNLAPHLPVDHGRIKHKHHQNRHHTSRKHHKAHRKHKILLRHKGEVRGLRLRSLGRSNRRSLFHFLLEMDRILRAHLDRKTKQQHQTRAPTQGRLQPIVPLQEERTHHKIHRQRDKEHKQEGRNLELRERCKIHDRNQHQHLLPHQNPFPERNIRLEVREKRPIARNKVRHVVLLAVPEKEHNHKTRQQDRIEQDPNRPKRRKRIPPLLIADARGIRVERPLPVFAHRAVENLQTQRHRHNVDQRQEQTERVHNPIAHINLAVLVVGNLDKIARPANQMECLLVEIGNLALPETWRKNTREHQQDKPNKVKANKHNKEHNRQEEHPEPLG
eukprot:comp22514_c0_seq1/m.56420 comp22514_c0_seq1/g.56420  ORF comp22514_c0_seq1/g.56420 comp22514_c0_seq1/m.56420 type:complete len:380 (-) comp22514_c0_seq1:1440-2579(-)